MMVVSKLEKQDFGGTVIHLHYQNRNRNVEEKLTKRELLKNMEDNGEILNINNDSSNE